MTPPVAEGLLATALMTRPLLGLSIGGAREPTNTDAPPAEGVSEVAGGGYSAYALLHDGRVWAWGDDLEGQLGNGVDGNALDNLPVRVLHLSGVSALAASANSAFALGDDGTVWAWGDDSEGELGNREETYTSELPVRVEGLHGIKQLAAGEFLGYALGQDGALVGLGRRRLGPVGEKPFGGYQRCPYQGGRRRPGAGCGGRCQHRVHGPEGRHHLGVGRQCLWGVIASGAAVPSRVRYRLR